MFWRRRQRETPTEPAEPAGHLTEPPEAQLARSPLHSIRIERGAPRAASITRVAEELRRRGEEVVELFKEITSPAGQAVLPIYLRRDGEVFIEVGTAPWESEAVRGILKTAAVLRSSEHSEAKLEVLSAYPLPGVVRYFCERTPAALFQLDLVPYDDLSNPEACADAFRKAAKRHWDLDLDYDPEELPLVEELLLAALGEGAEDRKSTPILDALVHGYGCYVGQILHHRANRQSSWRPAADWGEGVVLEFPNTTADPIGKTRAFFENGPEDSTAYYAAYALEELNRSSSEPDN